MNGMETMLKTLLKAMGFNPNEFLQGMQTFLDNGMSRLAAMETKLNDMHVIMARVDDRTAQMCNEVPPASTRADDLAALPVPIEVLQ